MDGWFVGDAIEYIKAMALIGAAPPGAKFPASATFQDKPIVLGFPEIKTEEEFRIAVGFCSVCEHTFLGCICDE
jgi:hypothetical protein